MQHRAYVARPGGVLVTPPPTDAGGPRPMDLSDLIVMPVPPLPQPSDTVELFLSALAALAQNTQNLQAAILQEIRETVQRGYVFPLAVTVANLAPDEYTFDPPLFSLSITNDGPANIQYKIPYTGQAQYVQLAPTEFITFNFVKGLIRSIGLRLTPAGGAATGVRIVGAY